MTPPAHREPPLRRPTVGERTWPHLIATLLQSQELSAEDTAWAMGEIMSGTATPAQIAGFGVPLSDELRAEAVDVVGTGGDRARTVNISTMAAVVLAGAGVRVVKHGGRAASSACGSADLVEHFGVPLDLGPEGVLRCVREAGI